MSRVIEMIQAERKRLGFSKDTEISENSPSILRMTVVADFLLTLEMLRVLLPEHLKANSNHLANSAHFLLQAGGFKPLLRDPQFSVVLNALKKDYLDAMGGKAQ